MASNQLRLNPAKTEFIWCSTSKMSHRVDQVTSFLIDGIEVPPVKSVKLLGVHIDSELTMTAHVSHTVSAWYYQLRRMKTARRSLPLKSAKSLVRAFVMSRLDYCNGILAGIDHVKCFPFRVKS